MDDRERARIVRWVRRYGGLPPAYVAATEPGGLDILVPPDERYQRAITAIRDQGDRLSAGDMSAGNVLLVGPHGSGKTTALVWLFTRAMEGEVSGKQNTGLWIRARDLFGLKDDPVDAPDKENKRLMLERVKWSKVLAVDDIGRPDVPSWRRDFLHDIIEDRKDCLLPTLITTSSTDKDLKEKFGERFVQVLSQWDRIALIVSVAQRKAGRSV